MGPMSHCWIGLDRASMNWEWMLWIDEFYFLKGLIVRTR